MNWETGHWLTGRLGGAPLDGLVAQLLEDSGIGGCDATGLGEGPDGYVVDRPMAPRSAIEPLSKAYAFDASEQAGVLAFRPRGGEPVAELDEDDLVLRSDAPPFRLIRAQETELPREISFGYSDGAAEHRRATVLGSYYMLSQELGGFAAPLLGLAAGILGLSAAFTGVTLILVALSLGVLAIHRRL